MTLHCGRVAMEEGNKCGQHRGAEGHNCHYLNHLSDSVTLISIIFSYSENCDIDFNITLQSV